jgi:hypothetical protein
MDQRLSLITLGVGGVSRVSQKARLWR